MKPAKVPAVPSLTVVAETNKNRLYRNKAFPFVRHGTVYGFALKEDLVKPKILREESAIFALLALECNLTYGLTGGKHGHLFYFHPAFGVSHVSDIGTGPVSGGALVAIGNEEILGGWFGPTGGGLFRHHIGVEAAQGLEQFLGEITPVEFLPALGKGEGVSALVCNRASRTVYGLTSPGNNLFSLAVDDRKAKPKMLAKIEGASPVLALLPDGRLLGAYAEGRLWAYDPRQVQLQALPVQAPCQSGKRYVANVASLLVCANGLVYGGTGVDGYLFRFDPVAGDLVNLGKPSRQSYIRALAEGHDGLIYGIVDEPKGMAHLFTYNPAGGGFADLGILGTTIPEYWFAHSIGTMSVGPFGEIFLGETDDISHLFIYYPPIPRAVKSNG